MRLSVRDRGEERGWGQGSRRAGGGGSQVDRFASQDTWCSRPATTQHAARSTQRQRASFSPVLRTSNWLTASGCPVPPVAMPWGLPPGLYQQYPSLGDPTTTSARYHSSPPGPTVHGRLSGTEAGSAVAPLAVQSTRHALALACTCGKKTDKCQHRSESDTPSPPKHTPTPAGSAEP